MDSVLMQSLRAKINEHFLCDEKTAVDQLISQLDDYNPDSTGAQSQEWIEIIRKNTKQQSISEQFLHEYQLNTREGIVLLNIAEALLRIPDEETQNQFLADQLASATWPEHPESSSLLMSLSTGALNLSGSFERYLHTTEKSQRNILQHAVDRLGQSVIRTALKQAMRILAAQFVIAETIEQAIDKSHEAPDYLYSFDMLGEAALTAADAERYYQAYISAINSLGVTTPQKNQHNHSGISVKLSALCPRYEVLQQDRAVPELKAKLLYLAKCARNQGISITIDAEEANRLEMSLDIFAAVYASPELENWEGLGLAVQAYQKRAIHVLHWLKALASLTSRKIPVRLVKGAYWDTEIKLAQENGLSQYPVFTRKTATDISYLACAQFLLQNTVAFYPQFATHNAHTVAAVAAMAKSTANIEFQRLHGMGEALYRMLNSDSKWKLPCRIYAPVGNFNVLLPYLVRRLLENSANSSFVNQLENPAIATQRLIQDPVLQWQSVPETEKTSLPLPARLYKPKRINSLGLNLADSEQIRALKDAFETFTSHDYSAYPFINGKSFQGAEKSIYCPFDHRERIGSIIYSDQEAVLEALKCADLAFSNWRLVPVQRRAEILNKAADLLEFNRNELVYLCLREGGRVLQDALAEIREAVDFCRYYAACALDLFANPIKLPGPTGENNQLTYFGRGIFVCISPWNFPVAIFLGQITAALATGNTVIAKPAEATSLTALFCIRLLHQAGIPESVLHCLPGHGAEIGDVLLADPRVAGVAFTGSSTTAQHINRQLAQHQPIIPLIAETGGQNVLIADNSAHTEQLVKDVLQSAFNSAGQRCSALRTLFVPVQTADKVIDLLIGAMHQLVIGNPFNFDTDIGPLINQHAIKPLSRHLNVMEEQAKILYSRQLDEQHRWGYYFPPTLIEIERLSQLTHEVFGPVLHIVRYHPEHLDQVIESINATGYGLTLGIFSRIPDTIKSIQQHCKVGNVYINRNMIGAVVGTQPFGGMGMSGTGFKAGGPNYLLRFSVEQTVTTNTAAIGGNIELLSHNLK